MWPKKINLSVEECRALLRNYGKKLNYVAKIFKLSHYSISELEAYSSVMNAFRTQGNLTDDKSRILKDLRIAFHISDDRHKAEARRVSNDERFNTIADIISGCETSRSWTKEGRRVIPLIPRGLAESAFVKVADTYSQKYTKQNDVLSHPSNIIVSRPETVTFQDPFRVTPVPQFLDEKSVIFDEKIAIKLEERIPLTTEDDTVGWSRKRRSSTENINLNQKLYPHVMKAQLSAGKRGGVKRPRKEKVSKFPNAPSTNPKLSPFEDSNNRTQDRQHRDDEYNMRIIHSYASSSMPLVATNMKHSQKKQTLSGDCFGSANSQTIKMFPSTKLSKASSNTKTSPQTPVLSNFSEIKNQISTKLLTNTTISLTPTRSTSEVTNQMPLASSSKSITEKPPKIQILSNNPVKIVPSLSLKTLQATGNVQVVQSPPGKVVLRSFNNDAEHADARLTEIKGIPQTIAGAKLSVQKVHLMPVQNTNSKANANFLIVRNSIANTGKLITASSASNESKDHMNIPVSTIQTLNVGKDGQIICMSPSKSMTTSNLQSIQVKPLIDTSVTKMEIRNQQQAVQKIRLIPTSSSVSRTLPTAVTQIKLSKSSKLYPISCNNGTTFADMFVVNKNSSPTIVNLPKINENIENEKVDWENELDKKYGTQKESSSSKVIVQSIPVLKDEEISNVKKADIVG